MCTMPQRTSRGRRTFWPSVLSVHLALRQAFLLSLSRLCTPPEPHMWESCHLQLFTGV